MRREAVSKRMTACCLYHIGFTHRLLYRPLEKALIYVVPHLDFGLAPGTLPLDRSIALRKQRDTAREIRDLRADTF